MKKNISTAFKDSHYAIIFYRVLPLLPFFPGWLTVSKESAVITINHYTFGMDRVAFGPADLAR